MTQEEKEALRDIMKAMSLLDCFNKYSNQSNNQLRITFEVIHYLFKVDNLFDFYRHQDEIMEELKENYPGLMTIGNVADVENETSRYFELLEKHCKIETIV